MTNPQSAIRDPKSPRRLGIFGGSFDPVHQGHLVLADCCLEQAELDSVWFVPAAQQPLKPQGPEASDAHRLAMLELAVASRPEFHVSTLELERGEVSYTIDTLESIRDQRQDAELFFLMGSDSLAELPKWHRVTEVCELALPLIVHRAGTDSPDFHSLQGILSAKRVDLIRQSQVEMPATAISSSQIRQLIAEKGRWDNFVSQPVADYIRQHGVYGHAC